jgi:hypothetical protein
MPWLFFSIFKKKRLDGFFQDQSKGKRRGREIIGNYPL